MGRFVTVTALSLILAVSTSAWADIVLTHKMVMETMGMGGFEMAVVERIKGGMNHTTVSKTGIGMMAGDGSAAENIIINRMDKGVMWVLEPAAKTYTEYSLANIKAMVDSSEAMTAEDSMGAQEYDWTITIDTLGDTVINGFACTGLRGIADGLSKNPPGARTRLTYEVWAGKDLPGNAELDNYYEQLSDRAGQDAYYEGDMVSQIFGKGKKQLAQLGQAIKGLKGFPTRTVVTVATSVDLGKKMEGEAGDDSEATAMMEQVKALMKGQVGEDGLTTMMSMHSDVITIEVVPVDAAIFEIPEGYTRGF